MGLLEGEDRACEQVSQENAFSEQVEPGLGAVAQILSVDDRSVDLREHKHEFYIFLVLLVTALDNPVLLIRRALLKHSLHNIT